MLMIGLAHFMLRDNNIMHKIIELEYTGKTLGDCISGDIVEFFKDGRLYVVQGFIDGNAVLAHVDRHKLCFSEGLSAIDDILESLQSDYDVAPISYDNFREVYPRRIERCE